jgi:hypothetical protein
MWMIILAILFAALLLFVGVGSHFMSDHLTKSDATNSLVPDALSTAAPNVFDSIDPQTGEPIAPASHGNNQ